MNHSFYLVAGLGKTGLSIVRYLQRRNKAFVVFDTREQAPGLTEFRQEFPHISVYLQEVPHTILDNLTDIITSPGLSLDLPLLQQAKQRGIAIYGDIECLAREIHAPIVAITGTNGKSTVTTLVGDMAKKAGISVAVAGNIGSPVLDMLMDTKSYDLWVLELSSFQLDLTYSLAPTAATILNVSPDHLDRHHTIDTYIQAKQRVYHQTKSVVYNKDDEATRPIDLDPAKTHIISFEKNKPVEENWGLIKQEGSIYLAKGDHCIFPVESLLIKGVHNWLNALAACALADAVGIALESIIDVLQHFSGLSHRCQWVRSFNHVDWINDSKGTNVGATISAINGIGGAMQGKIVLIAGGQGKGADFHELTQSVSDFVRSVVLIGEDANKIEAALKDTVPTIKTSSLEKAVTLAHEQAQPGDVVLLSPACASLDMFRDFNHRGEVFTSSVLGL